MVDSPLRRAIFSLAFFWIGIHFVGLGIVMSGTNHRFNPTWVVFMDFFSLEVLAFKCLLGCGILVGGYHIIQRVPKVPHTHGENISSLNDSEPSPDAAPVKTETLPRSDIQTPLQNHQSEVRQPVQPSAQEQPEKFPDSPKPPADPEALKQKAIDQILRGY